VGEVTVVRRLFPVVGEHVRANELVDGDLGLARPVRAHEAHVLAGPKRPRVVHDLVPGRHGRDEIGAERLLAARRNQCAKLVCRSPSPLGVDVPDQRLVPAGDERACRRAAVHSRADHRGAPGALATERFCRKHRRGTRPQRRDRARVQRGAKHPVRRVGQKHETRHGRQAAFRVAGKGRHPFEQGVAAAERRHRAKVARRVRGHVDLRRHRPLAARVGDECVPDGRHRVVRRHRRLHVARRKERDRRQRR
jgi:hypothetical protein